MSYKNLQEGINLQIKHEMDSFYLYLSMATWFDVKGYLGMASWMKIQAMEEYKHAMKFYEFMNDRGFRVELLQLEKPATDWKSPLDAFQAAFNHEKLITSRIHALHKMALEQADYAAIPLLHWFINEQVEEEAHAARNVELLEQIGDHKGALFMLDHELGHRKE
jgi:ferritin